MENDVEKAKALYPIVTKKLDMAAAKAPFIRMLPAAKGKTGSSIECSIRKIIRAQKLPNQEAFFDLLPYDTFSWLHILITNSSMPRRSLIFPLLIP